MRAALCILLLFVFTPCWAEMIVGSASVVDGDTIEIRGQRVRLFGIDAPEIGRTCKDAGGQVYPCGQRAALVLGSRIGGGVVYCDQHDTDGGGQVVATCRAWGENLSAWMVGLGWAVADRACSTRFVPAENLARARRAGLWAGEFMTPSEGRRSH